MIHIMRFMHCNLQILFWIENSIHLKEFKPRGGCGDIAGCDKNITQAAH